MTKMLVTCSQTKALFREIRKTNRALALVYDMLYRIDDALAWRDDSRNDSLIAYDVDGQQPYGDGSYLDPELTKTLVDSMKLAKMKVKRMFDLNMDTITIIIVVAAVGISVATTVMK